MKSALNQEDSNLKLLSTLDLEEVCEITAGIVVSLCDPKAVAILIFDPDLEVFSDKFVYGAKKKDFLSFVSSFAEQVPAEKQEIAFGEVDTDADFADAKLAADLEPVFYLYFHRNDVLCACLLIAGYNGTEAGLIAGDLAGFELSRALYNAWEMRELRRENERLRSRYEELETQNGLLEEQTRKLIHDTMAKDSLRTQHVDRERLVYEISNAVRSSLEIHSVLQTAVNQIGATFALSRCVLLKPAATSEGLVVFEYHHSDVKPSRDFFLTAAGRTFVEVALNKTAPHVVSADDDDVFDLNHLKELELLSGLLIPLIMRDRTIGAIFLQDCKTPRVWSIDNTALAGSLADQLSVAIENADLHEEKKQQAVTDGLTGIANRRHFNDVFEKEFERAKRYGEPLSLVVVDLDYLKKLNDTHGHHMGDLAIKCIGHLMSISCRSVDLPARYGGEEFCLLLPNTDLEMAENTAERLRKLIAETPISGEIPISASIGVATFPLHATERDALFEAADAALYKAKEAGRNCVCVSERTGGKAEKERS